MKKFVKPKNMVKIVLAITAVWLVTATLSDTHSSYVESDYYTEEDYNVQTEELLGVDEVAEILETSENLYEDELEQEVWPYAEEVDTHAEEIDAPVEELAVYAEEVDPYAESATVYVEEVDAYTEEEVEIEELNVAEGARPVRDFFEDESLAAAVARGHRFGSNIDTYVTLADLEEITRVIVNPSTDGYVTSIVGLEQLVSLERFSLDGSSDVDYTVSDLSPLASLTNLEYLVIRWKGIRDIAPLSGLYNLTYLSLFNNNVSDITPLSELTNLENLYLTINNISDFRPLASLTNLTSLGVSIQSINLGQVAINQPVPFAVYYPNGTRVDLIVTDGTADDGNITWHQLGEGAGRWNSSFEIGGLEVSLFSGSISSEIVETIDEAPEDEEIEVEDENVEDDQTDEEPSEDEPVVTDPEDEVSSEDEPAVTDPEDENLEEDPEEEVSPEEDPAVAEPEDTNPEDETPEDEPTEDEPSSEEDEVDEEDPTDNNGIVGDGWTDVQYGKFEALVAQVEEMFLTPDEVASFTQMIANFLELPYAQNHPFVYALVQFASEHGGEVAGVDAEGLVELLAEVVATVAMGTRGVGFQTIMDIMELLILDVETLTTILRNSIQLAPYSTENIIVYSNVREHTTFIVELIEIADGTRYYSRDDVITLTVRDCNYEITVREVYELMDDIFVGLRDLIEGANVDIYADFISETTSIEDTITALATNNDEFNYYIARIEAILGSIDDCGAASGGDNAGDGNNSGDNNDTGGGNDASSGGNDTGGGNDASGGGNDTGGGNNASEGDNVFNGDTPDEKANDGNRDITQPNRGGGTPSGSGGEVISSHDGGNNNRPVLPQTGVAVVTTTLAGMTIASIGVMTAVTKYKKK